jgi:uncharacterized repeat protein (TIGR01451 family)
MVEHRVVVYSDSGLTKRVAMTEWTLGTEADVFGLADGMTYHLVLLCRDGFGNMGTPSEPAGTTMDSSAPTLTLGAAAFGPLDGQVFGECSDGGSGVDAVEYSVDGGETWTSADMEDGSWSFDLPSGVDGAWVRATDTMGNVAGLEWAVVDSTGPAIVISSPAAGADVSGAVTLLGSITDPNLASYTVEVKMEGDSTWTTVQPTQATTGVAGTLATWLTAGMTGGDYELRVTATDTLSNSETGSVTVTLKGAHLSIGTGDISFSDSHPLPGDMVTVLITVRNDGASPAENVQVTLMDEGKEVGSETVTVPAHGTAVVPIKVKAGESHDFTARAQSPLYDTGAMDTGQPLQSIEEEAALENAGGILGLIALILAVIALLLIILGKMGGREGPEPMAESPDDVIVDPMMEVVDTGPEPEPEPLPPPLPPQ